MSSLHSTVIESPAGDFSVTIENHGEHHMSCDTIIIAPSQPIGGISRFRTTNGHAFFTPDGHGLIMQDACVILFTDLTTGNVYHHEPPERQYFTNVRIESGSLLSDLYGRDTNRGSIPPIPLADISSTFARGLGRVAEGRFPSAYP